MPELKNDVAVKGGKNKGNKEKEQKPVEQKPSGTAAPIPTEADVPTAEAKAADEKAQKLAAAKNAAAEAIKAKLEALKKELAATKEAEKAERDKEKNAKKAEREKSLAVRAEKEKQLAEADAKITKAQKDLELTDEWKALKTLEAERAAIGPLPKVSKGGGGGSGKPRGPRGQDAGGLTASAIRAMKAIRDSGHALSRKELFEATGQEKGWSKLLGKKDGGNGLVGEGLLNLVMHEDEPMRYSLTEEGKTALAKAEAELAKAPVEAPTKTE
jgi:flagellar biosynthesis GTPase FlhF